jgi:hypothetical protein
VTAATNRGPLVTLVAAALVGAGLLVANVLTDPARMHVAETPVSAVTSAAPAGPTTTTPAATTTTTTSPARTSTTTAPPVADAYRASAVYVGRDAARRTSVAVAVRDGHVAAYLCDGKSLESWLTGTASSSTATLTRGDDRLVAEATGSGLHLTGTVHSRTVDVTATLASAPAGLYRLDTTGTTVGWIIQPDGSQVGLQDRGGVVAPAPILVPGQPVTVDGRPAYPQE